jgi:hypothetical protein
MWKRLKKGPLTTLRYVDAMLSDVASLISWHTGAGGRGRGGGGGGGHVGELGARVGELGGDQRAHVGEAERQHAAAVGNAVP